ncbi:MAG: N-6 DNA methylase [Rikenellaceae bacterium]|nr:N-6 DNA methylase [Rikenellaceae bacterium]
MRNKKKYGQYFTTGSVADFMVSLISKPKNSDILEPSCGEGVFLNSLQKNSFSNIHAYEIDSTLNNSFSYVRYESFVSSPVSEKFDVVIGNPPYIRWKNLEPDLKEELQHNSLWQKYFNSLCDYLFIFVLKSIEQLREEGELIFITPEYWLNTTHSASLRNYMCQNGFFNDIYHFKEVPLFEEVASSYIIFKYTKSRNRRQPINLYRYSKKSKPQHEELISLSCFEKISIPQFSSDSRWLLTDSKMQQQIRTFERKCMKTHGDNPSELSKIGDICDIGNGMVSGLDKAFRIDTDTNTWTAQEKRSIIQVLKAKDLDAYSPKGDSRYIFIPSRLSKEEFDTGYPHIKKILDPFKERLQERYDYNREVPYWEFVFLRNKQLFDKPESKIFIPCKERISHKKYFRFCLAKETFYPLQDVTAIYKKQHCKENLQYILAYLNNTRVFDWLIYNGIIKGDIVEFSEAPIANIPFRPIDWENENEVRIHDTISNEVELYMKDRAKEHIDIINRQFNILFND